MAVLAWGMAAAFMTIGQSAAGGFTPPKVAVVNVPAVSERYLRTSDLEAQFEERRVKLNQQRDAMQERIERTGRSLQEELKPGTKEFEERRKQLAMLEAELQWFIETEGQKVEQGLAGSLRSIYSDIQTAVRAVAEEKGIDLVLAADQLPNEASQSITQVRQQIVLQKVVYWNARLDLTDDVVTRLNAEYRAQRLNSPAGAAQPPLCDEDHAPAGVSPQP